MDALNTISGIDSDLAKILAFEALEDGAENETVLFNLSRAQKMGLPNVRDFIPQTLDVHETTTWRSFYRDRGPGAKFEDFIVRVEDPCPNEFYMIFVDGLLLKIGKKNQYNTIHYILLKTRIKIGTVMTIVSNKGVVPHESGSLSYTFSEGDFDRSLPDRCDPPTDLVDIARRDLFIDKKGFIKGLFFTKQANCVKTIELYDRVRRFFYAELGYGLYATHGTALGLVRNKRIIENDDDFDCGYVSSYRTCEAVSMERFAVADALRRGGFNCGFSTTGHLIVREGKYVVDIGPSWFDASGDFNASGFSSFPGTAADFLPLKSVQYLQHSVLLLNNTEKWFALNYGQGWSIPDPFYITVAPKKALKHREIFMADKEYFAKFLTRSGQEGKTT